MGTEPQALVGYHQVDQYIFEGLMPVEKRKKGFFFKEIMMEQFQNLVKDMNMNIQESWNRNIQAE